MAIPTSVTLDTPRKSGLLKRLISAVVLLPVETSRLVEMPSAVAMNSPRGCWLPVPRR